MPESVPVRCPDCRRERLYTPPSYPCACGARVAMAPDRRAVPSAVRHRVWEEQWVAVPCGACGRLEQWPQPELGCPCGTLLRIPVAREGAGTATATPRRRPPSGPAAGPASPAAAVDRSGTAPPAGRTGRAGPRRPAGESEPATPAGPDARAGRSQPGAPPGPEEHAGPAGPVPRAAFRPVAIRTARDAVTTTVLYLRWLGYRDVRRAHRRPPRGIGLAARGVLAQVDPAAPPAALRDVECLWLTAMTESADCVYFSRSGYAGDARARADLLGVPLFVLPPSGVPRPVNAAARELAAPGNG
ncbi:hypothetical protein ACL02U_12885 [Streptomyces sp. MS06]|uniref:hypothetical protein n=1 Tax=Streptomyces sp. MS06 TaxID=3385974 RepID=UPI0039A2E57F